MSTENLNLETSAAPEGRLARAIRAVADVFRDQRDERTRARARYPYLDWQA